MDTRAVLLIVDDVDVNRAILQELFEQTCEVLEACNGKEALSVLDARPETDLVLMDIDMPVMDGFEALRAIREQPRFSQLPVILCTPHENESDEIRALDLGVTDFFRKPFNDRVLRHRVKNILEMKRLQAYAAEQRSSDHLLQLMQKMGTSLGVYELCGNEVQAIYLNDYFFEVSGFTREEYMPYRDNVLRALKCDEADALLNALQENKKHGTPVEATVHIRRKVGGDLLQQIRALPIRFGDADRQVYLTSITDLTQQHKAEKALRESDSRLNALIDAVPGGIATYEFDEGGMRTVYFNDAICEIVGYDRAQYQALLDQTEYRAFVVPEDVPLVEGLIEEFCRTPRTTTATFRLRHREGGVRWVRMSGAPMLESDGRLLANVVLLDVTRDRQNEARTEEALAELRYSASHDALTGIYNREAFYRQTELLLKRNPDEQYVLLAMDIERFKIVNDLFGKEVGDRVLIAIGRGLDKTLRNLGTYARLEADHFIACFPISYLNMDRIIGDFDHGFKQQQLDYHIEMSFGIYRVHNRTVPVNQMCDRAVIALQTTKGNVMKRFALYDDEMRQSMLEEQAILDEMNTALEDGQFVPYLQPIYDLSSGLPAGAEVLVRWQHPQKGMIGPNKFIPLFERNGFITKLDAVIWEKACELLQQWKKMGQALPLSVNISRIDLYNPHLCEDLLALIRKYGLEPSLLKLEITESAYVDDPDDLMRVVNRLRAAGFAILMDDFGSGYSSLNVLMDMPVDVIKLDMRFLSELDRNDRAASIMTSVVRMARWLAMPVIAEGVETDRQLEFLRSIGCESAQGYHFARPMPAEDFTAMLSGKERMRSRCVPENQIDLESVWNSSLENSLLFDGMIGGMGLIKLEGERATLLRASDSYFKLLGGTPKQMLETDPVQCVAPEDREPLMRKCQDAVNGGRVETILLRHRHADGRLLWLEFKLRYLGRSGNQRVFYFTFNDLTRQRAFQQSSDELDAFADAFDLRLGVIAVGTEEEPRVEYLSRELRQRLAPDSAPLDSVDLWRGVAPEDEARLRAVLREASGANEACTLEYEMKNEKGERVRLRARACPWRGDARGRVLVMIADATRDEAPALV